MRMQMEALMGELKESKNLEQMAALEDEMAGVLGNGFLKGRFDYEYLMEVKESVEQIEAECREQFAFEIQKPAKRTAFQR